MGGGWNEVDYVFVGGRAAGHICSMCSSGRAPKESYLKKGGFLLMFHLHPRGCTHVLRTKTSMYGYLIQYYVRVYEFDNRQYEYKEIILVRTAM